MKLREGNIFTPVCQPFCPLGVYVFQHALAKGVCVSRHAPGQEDVCKQGVFGVDDGCTPPSP